MLLPEPPGEHVCDILNRLWGGDFDAHCIHKNRTKDGRIVECEWTNTPVLNSEGKVTGGISFGRDITATRHPDFAAVDLNHVRDRDLSLLVRLTPRQREVLRLVAEGYRTKEIAESLSVCVKTVEMHRTGMMSALDIHDVAGLVRFAIRVGLISAYDEA